MTVTMIMIIIIMIIMVMINDNNLTSVKLDSPEIIIKNDVVFASRNLYF